MTNFIILRKKRSSDETEGSLLRHETFTSTCCPSDTSH